MSTTCTQRAFAGPAEIEIEEHKPECIIEKLVNNIEGYSCAFISDSSIFLAEVGCYSRIKHKKY